MRVRVCNFKTKKSICLCDARDLHGAPGRLKYGAPESTQDQ